IGVFRHLSLFPVDWDPSRFPVFYADGVRGLVIVVTVLAGGLLLSRRRDRLSRDERWTPEAWTALGHLLLAIWIGQEGSHVATAWFSGPHFAVPPGAGISIAGRRGELQLALCGAAWMAQAGLIAVSAPRHGGAFLRWSSAI